MTKNLKLDKSLKKAFNKEAEKAIKSGKLTITCPQCGYKFSSSHHRCPKCGSTIKIDLN